MALSQRKKEGNPSGCERKDLTHHRRPILFQQVESVKLAVQEKKESMKFGVQTIGLGKKLPSKLELNTSLGQQEYGVAIHLQDRPDVALALSKATFEGVLSTHVNKSPCDAISIIQSLCRGSAATTLNAALDKAYHALYRNKLVLFNDHLPDWNDSDIIAGAQVYDKGIKDDKAQASDFKCLGASKRKKAKWIAELHEETEIRFDKLNLTSTPNTFTIKPSKFEDIVSQSSIPSLFVKFAGLIENNSPVVYLARHDYGWRYAEDLFKLFWNEVLFQAFRSYGTPSECTDNQVEYLKNDLLLNEGYRVPSFLAKFDTMMSLLKHFPQGNTYDEVGNGNTLTSKDQFDCIWTACERKYQPFLERKGYGRKETFNSDLNKLRQLLGECDDMYVAENPSKAKAKEDKKPSNKKKDEDTSSKAKARKEDKNDVNKTFCPVCFELHKVKRYHKISDCYSVSKGGQKRSGTGNDSRDSKRSNSQNDKQFMMTEADMVNLIKKAKNEE